MRRLSSAVVKKTEVALFHGGQIVAGLIVANTVPTVRTLLFQMVQGINVGLGFE